MKRSGRSRRRRTRNILSSSFLKKIKLPDEPPSVKSLLLFAGISTVAGLVLLALIIVVMSKDLPSLEQLETYQPRLITKIYGKDDAILKEFYTQRRIQVPRDSVSKYMQKALIAVEDRKFYAHWGVDPFAIVRAVVVNMTTMSTKQGASTLTQQLARQQHLHLRQTYKRKIREVITAVQIERTYGKDEIIEMYLNQMPFGHGVYGVEAASLLYFQKKAKYLTLAESAMLTGLLKAPAHYSPFRHPAKALKRRNVVLHAMRDAGVIDNKAYEAAVKTPLQAHDARSEDQIGIAPYYTEWIRQQLRDMQKEYDFDYYKDGLIVQTTLDTTVQKVAEAAVDSHMTKFQAEFNERFLAYGLRNWLEDTYRDSLLEDSLSIFKGITLDSLGYDSLALDSLDIDSLRNAVADSNKHLKVQLEDSVRTLAAAAILDSMLVDSLLKTEFKVQIAFVALDPLTGDILAMIGGRDFRESKYNRAVQAVRQPGSVFKLFAYTAAVDNGYYGNEKILNMVQPIKMPDNTWWRPENYNTDNRGSYVSLRRALQQSLNNITVRMVNGDDKLLPVKEVIRYARRFGITTRLRAVPSLALGAMGVIPLEITSCYSVIASGGIKSKPRSILSIQHRTGQEIVSFPAERETALSAETAYIMTDLLENVVNRGTGASSRWRHKFYASAGGKTGTTNNFTDAWFVGFTPRIVAGVWIGFDDPSKSLGPHQSGSRAALPVWAIFMREVHKAKGWGDLDFEEPLGVVRVRICDDSGELAGPFCPNIVEEVFRRGDEPMTTCTVHRIQ